MFIKSTLVALAILSLTACQGGLNSYQAYTGACTQHPHDAGYCELPTNWRLSSYIAGERQPGDWDR